MAHLEVLFRFGTVRVCPRADGQIFAMKVQDVRAPPAAVRVVAARRFLRPLSVATVSYAGLGARTRKPRKRGRTARSEAVQSAGDAASTSRRPSGS